ncbi:S-(hydroxymethyl)glutathione dehydrogenase/alcohol dehydrogenase [Mycobacterium frederiksbergense]|uniref:S-(Hydroxymethyl)glutathione dehydrogenase/alcohol dehydrogenase n=1 Tax=Mycolicibacterium frederiksbergense TaxID=117567 RepID=A0ABT6L7L9_9MYCO|nr:Zn-dependent alcohol dehydrogenase [Mycolicibacterium frederiksbergense]MDH6198601.1 S-(hydroxymethyl)glutathione dehydrogenase/alcohol dehydrogenase [Mycolicibacterium frederiksbergense]
MKAAILREPGSLVIEDVTRAAPGPQEVVVQIAAAGLCHTDLHFLDGHMACPTPTILGHETAGVVTEVGRDVRGLAPGDHVIGCLSAFCGSCEYCLTGRPSICEGAGNLVCQGPSPRLADGSGAPISQFMHLSAFADEALVHQNAVVKVNSAIPLDRAAIIGCAVMTGFGAVTHTAKVSPGESVAVIGCGAVGLSIVQCARLAGALNIVAIDLNPERLAVARSLGATATVDPRAGSVVDQVHDLTDGRGVHVAYEAVGRADLVESALLMTRKGGLTVMVGLLPPEQRLVLPFQPFVAERRLMGCDMGSNRFKIDMPRLAELYLQGRLNLDAMVTSRITLDAINGGFDGMRSGTGVRTVVTWPSGSVA